ncbi:MAG: hypothetical protein ABWY27_06900 [Telluria sp.]
MSVNTPEDDEENATVAAVFSLRAENNPFNQLFSGNSGLKHNGHIRVGFLVFTACFNLPGQGGQPDISRSLKS